MTLMDVDVTSKPVGGLTGHVGWLGLTAIDSAMNYIGVHGSRPPGSGEFAFIKTYIIRVNSRNGHGHDVSTINIIITFPKQVM